MDVGEIEDKESLEAWLNSLPKETETAREESQRRAVLIAHRTAMRVLPQFWSWSLSETMRKGDLTVLPVLWANLIGGVTVTYPTPPIKAAARSAHSAVRSAHAASNSAAAAADSAAFTASAAFSAVRSAHSAARSAHAAAYSARSAAFSAAAVWRALRTDCAELVADRDPNRLPLWSDDDPLGNVWSETRPMVLRQSPGWQFWVDWYDKALNGEPQDWPLLTKIALIDAKDWEQGADHVNALIQRIIEQHDLWKEARRLKAENERLVEQLRAIGHRSHNNPPELVEDLAPVTHSATIIWAALNDAERELEKQTPDASLLARVAQTLLEATKAVGAFCLSLGNGVLQGAARATGTGIVAYGSYLATQNEGVIAFATALLKFARGH